MQNILLAKADQKSFQTLLADLPQSAILIFEGGLNLSLISEIVRAVLGLNQHGLIKLKPEDGKKTISVAQVRELNLRLSLKAKSKNSRTLVLIENAAALTKEAQNALLKNIEEPVEGVHFLFLLNRPEELIATIRSRSQMVKLSNPSLGEITKFAEQEFGLSPQETQTLWLQAAQDLKKFLMVAASSESRQELQNVAENAKSFVQGSPEQKAILVAKLKDRPAAIEFLQTLLGIFQILAADALAKHNSELALKFEQKIMIVETLVNGLHHNLNLKITLARLLVEF